VTGSVPRGGDPATLSAFSGSEQASGSLDVGGLSGSISRPLSDGNGTYTVAVAMHPSDLGHLRAVMSLEGNDLQVLITPQTRSGHEALTNAVDALKSQLATAGLNVNVTLRDPGSSSGGDDHFEVDKTSGRSADLENETAPAPSTPVLVAGQIHLVL
jgi:flagellar hook-length control protein FliK